MTQALRQIHSKPFKDLRDNSTKADTISFGATGASLFYCYHYTSGLHRDRDYSWSIACQLAKHAEDPDYSFALAEWGIYIETRVNSLW